MPRAGGRRRRDARAAAPWRVQRCWGRLEPCGWLPCTASQPLGPLGPGGTRALPGCLVVREAVSASQPWRGLANASVGSVAQEPAVPAGHPSAWRPKSAPQGRPVLVCCLLPTPDGTLNSREPLLPPRVPSDLSPPKLISGGRSLPTGARPRCGWPRGSGFRAARGGLQGGRAEAEGRRVTMPGQAPGRLPRPSETGHAAGGPGSAQTGPQRFDCRGPALVLAMPTPPQRRSPTRPPVLQVATLAREDLKTGGAAVHEQRMRRAG